MSDANAQPRTGRKRERTRSELVAAAEQLVADHGIDAVSIDDITEAADVAKGTFYTHFSDKNDLAAAIALRTRHELEEKITALNDGVVDAALRMANGLSTMLAFAIANPIRARALLRLQPGTIDPDTKINAGLRGDIERGQQSKRFWAASTSASVVTIIGGIMIAIMHLSGTSTGRNFDAHAFASDVIATLLLALGLKQTEATRLAVAAMKSRKKEMEE
jgi:AcrR family transcriptional regulator